MAFLAIALQGCSTHAVPRLNDSQILRNCADVVEKIRFRDQFFKQSRGKAEVEGLGVETDVELVINDHHELRMEFVGPLGIRLGLLQINADWVYLFMPRDKTVLRFPAAELYKNTARRARFLRLLPIPVLPEAMFDSILTQVNLPSTSGNAIDVKQVKCGFDPDSQTYWLRIPSAPLSNYRGGRYVWVEPYSFSPVKILYFDGYLPEKTEIAQGRPLISVEYSKLQGQGQPSALPRKVVLTSDDGTKLRFEWDHFEMVQSYNSKAFGWRPAASMTVKDY